jgi:hypothetical protein
MLEYNVIFNTSYEPNLTFIGTVKQFSDNQYKLKVYLPDLFDTGYQITANIQRNDEQIGSYALSFDEDHYILSFGAWTTAISGELKITIQAVSDGDIFVFKTIIFNVEETVEVSDYDPDIESPEFISIMEALATKQNADADLTSIAGLTATSGVLKKVSANNWALSSNYFELVDGLIPAEYLPTYVDDVIEGILVNSTTFTVGGVEITPESGKIYVSLANEKVYRWSGTLFVEISSQITVGNLTGQAFDGAIGKSAFDNAALAVSWGNHANFGYLTNNSSTITNLQNTTSTLTNNVSTLTSNLSNLTNTVTTINGSYLTASSSTITNLSNAINSTNSNVANLTNVVANKVNTSLLGAVNGVATLDGAGKVPSSQLPSFVDDVLEYANLAGFPETGESGKIYIAIDTGLTYRWSGSIYVEISQSLALGNTSATAFRGDLGKEAYDWGNHANASYLTSEADTLDSVATRGNSTNTATINFVSSNQTNYNTNGTNNYATGQVGWNADVGTLDIGLYNGTVLHSGQQTLYWVKADETITVGDVVQFNGVAGFTPKVKKAVPSEINNNPTLIMGIASGNIANEANGYVTTFGMLKGVATTGLSLGDILFYNSNTNASAGTLTTTQPEAPNAKIQLAAVIKESTGGGLNGELLVRVLTPVSISDDSSVQLTNVANGEVLAYNGTANRWENKEVVSLGLNVALSNIQNDQYLAYDNGVWINRDLNAVTTTQITNWDNTYNIVNTTSGNWNSAFSWGNHQAVGYIVGLANDSVTSGNIALWNGTTGKLLQDGSVALQTSITNDATKLPTSSAVTTYVDGVIGDIETILDDIIG